MWQGLIESQEIEIVADTETLAKAKETATNTVTSTGSSQTASAGTVTHATVAGGTVHVSTPAVCCRP